MNTTTIAVDLAKHVFEVAVTNAAGGNPVRHRFTRAQFERFIALPRAGARGDGGLR